MKLLDKRLFTGLAGFLLFPTIMIALPSCGDDLTDPLGNPDPDPTEMVIKGMLPSIETRVNADEETMQLEWGGEDKIGVFYATELSEGEGGFINTPFSVSDMGEGNAQATFKPASKIEWNEDALSHKLWAVYPYDNENTDLTAIKFTVPSAASLSSDDLWGQLLLVSTGEYTEIPENAELNFTTPLSIVRLRLDPTGTLLDGETIYSVDFTSALDMAGEGVYNMETGAVTGFDQKTISFSIPDGVALDGATDFIFGINPNIDLAEENAEINVSIEGAGIDGNFTMTVPAQTQAGRINPVNVQFKTIVDEGNGEIEISTEKRTDVSNCYIIAPGDKAIIPVTMAYKAWETYMGAPLGDGELNCELKWMDTEGLARTSALKAVALMEADNNQDAGIYISAGEASGNALIALKLDDEIVWSWHIWVTDYDPDSAAGQKTILTHKLMDRNLGALSNTPDNNALGTAYQWGRKDPFPSNNGEMPASPTTPIPYRNIWAADGTPLQAGVNVPDLENTGIFVEQVKHEDEMEGIAYAIANPTIFISGTEAGEGAFPTWSTTRLSGRPHLDFKVDLWGTSWQQVDLGKSVFDPCPEGWRVPNDPEITRVLSETEINVVNEKGFDMGDYGYFPLGGYVKGYGQNAGLWVETNLYGQYWLSWTGGFGGRYGGYVHYREETLFHDFVNATYKCQGGAVRCEKEE